MAVCCCSRGKESNERRLETSYGVLVKGAMRADA
jgi:hypothetical protein